VTGKSEPHIGAGGNCGGPRGDTARGRRHARPLRPPARFCVSG
jgi:hypothetical protein